MKLLQLIKKFGEPKILIDHWQKTNIGLACFEIEQKLEWNDRGLFLNNQELVNPSIGVVQKIIDSWTIGVRWLETISPGQIDAYSFVQGLANDIIAEVFSNAVVTFVQL